MYAFVDKPKNVGIRITTNHQQSGRNKLRPSRMGSLTTGGSQFIATATGETPSMGSRHLGGGRNKLRPSRARMNVAVVTVCSCSNEQQFARSEEEVASDEILHGRGREAFLHREVLMAGEYRLQELLLLQIGDEASRGRIVQLVPEVASLLGRL